MAWGFRGIEASGLEATGHRRFFFLMGGGGVGGLKRLIRV